MTDPELLASVVAVSVTIATLAAWYHRKVAARSLIEIQEIRKLEARAAVEAR